MGVALNSVRASAEDIDPFFETFPEGGPWRLVWINGPHSNATDPFDPLIDCLFVGVGVNSLSKRALAGAGWLPLLSIGSVWHDGRKIADGAGALEACTLDVTIGSDRIREFGGYDPVSPQRKSDYILPPHVGSVAKFAGRRGVPRRRHRQAATPNRLAMKVAWAGMSLAGMAATCPLRTIARIS